MRLENGIRERYQTSFVKSLIIPVPACVEIASSDLAFTPA
jgi:hypothetical protein